MIDFKDKFLSDYINYKKVTLEKVVDDDCFSVVRVQIVFINFCSEDLAWRFTRFHHSNDQKRIGDCDKI